MTLPAVINKQLKVRRFESSRRLVIYTEVREDPLFTCQ